MGSLGGIETILMGPGLCRFDIFLILDCFLAPVTSGAVSRPVSARAGPAYLAGFVLACRFFPDVGRGFMKVSVKWVDGARMVGESASGHSVVMDGPPEHGGRNLGVRPMEMLLLGMGGCTEFDVIHILRKGRHHVDYCEVELVAERAETEPKVFIRIHVHFRIAGAGLTEKVVERAVQLSAEKYCSASIMLGQTAQITHDFELLETRP